MLRHILLLPALGLLAQAAEDVVELEAVRAHVSYLQFYVECAADADTVTEIRVTWVAPGSGAEKSGLQAGDRLMTINGVPVAGRKRSEIVNKAGGVMVRGKEVSFTGHRGLFRRSWSLTATIDVHGHMEPKEKKPGQTPEPTAPSDRASPRTFGADDGRRQLSSHRQGDPGRRAGAISPQKVTRRERAWLDS